MAYRPSPLHTLAASRELEAVRLERWFADALLAHDMRTRPRDTRLAAGFYFSGLLAIVAVVVESPVLAISGVIGVIVTVIRMLGLARQAGALEREAWRRGLSSERLLAIGEQRRAHGLGGWRHECDVRLRWLSWEAGEATSHEQRQALADDLARRPRLDARQADFVQAMRAERAAPDLPGALACTPVASRAFYPGAPQERFTFVPEG